MSDVPVEPAAGDLGAYINRMLTALEEAVRVQTRLLMYSRSTGRKVGRLAAIMEKNAHADEAGRDAAVEAVKKHVGEVVKFELAASTRWERRFLIVVGILIVLSNLFGAPVGDLLERVFKFPR